MRLVTGNQGVLRNRELMDNWSARYAIGCFRSIQSHATIRNQEIKIVGSLVIARVGNNSSCMGARLMELSHRLRSAALSKSLAQMHHSFGQAFPEPQSTIVFHSAPALNCPSGQKYPPFFIFSPHVLFYSSLPFRSSTLCATPCRAHPQKCALHCPLSTELNCYKYQNDHLSAQIGIPCWWRS